MTDPDIIKECRQTGRTKTTTKNLLQKAYHEQMTNEIDISTVGQHAKVLIEGDIATIMGVKYQRIIEPQSFYDKLWGLLKTKLGDTCGCDDMADKVRDLIRENIPEPIVGGIMEYNAGWNECIRKINKNIFK